MSLLIVNDIVLIAAAIGFVFWEQKRSFQNGRDVGYDEGWDDAKADTFCYFDQEDSTLLTTSMDQFQQEQSAWMTKMLNSPQQDGSGQ